MSDEHVKCQDLYIHRCTLAHKILLNLFHLQMTVNQLVHILFDTSQCTLQPTFAFDIHLKRIFCEELEENI